MEMFQIVTEPLLSLPVQAVVNRANACLQYASGLCAAIFDRAGKLKLQNACGRIGWCPSGEAVITDGFDLPARYIIHAVPPRWCGGKYGEDQLLASSYRRSLEIALQFGVNSVAFPLLSEGQCGYPRERGLEVAKNAITSFPSTEEMTVYLTLAPEPAAT